MATLIIAHVEIVFFMVEMKALRAWLTSRLCLSVYRTSFNVPRNPVTITACMVCSWWRKA
jgi:hypothetical protein